LVLIGAGIALLIFLRRRQKANPVYDTAILEGTALPNIDNLDALFALSGSSKEQWKSSNRIRKQPLEPGSESYSMVLALLRELDGKILADCITAVHGVINPQIAMNFDGFRAVLQRRFSQDPRLFKKDDWLQGDRADLRRWVSHSYGLLTQKYKWNSFAEAVPVVPLVHGTDLNVAWKILDTGFSALSSLDAGFYGRGIYFTSSALYALPYYSVKPSPCLIICLTIPGNIYPVVEDRREPNSLLGMPIKSGYQSNYVLTAHDGNPCLHRMQVGSYYDELVLDQEAQVVPIAIIEFDQSKLAPIARSFQREIPM